MIALTWLDLHPNRRPALHRLAYLGEIEEMKTSRNGIFHKTTNSIQAFHRL